MGSRLKSLGQSKIPGGHTLVPDHKSGLKTLGSGWATGPKWHHDMRLEPLDPNTLPGPKGVRLCT